MVGSAVDFKQGAEKKQQLPVVQLPGSEPGRWPGTLWFLLKGQLVQGLLTGDLLGAHQLGHDWKLVFHVFFLGGGNSSKTTPKQ